jgi:hypothetical protein
VVVAQRADSRGHAIELVAAGQQRVDRVPGAVVAVSGAIAETGLGPLAGDQRDSLRGERGAVEDNRRRR